ncbi:MAG: D-serine dehydratase [Rhodospirillaceae bacterium]|nr:D-serine dehydratase [Rhodospirillaceae bacterium]
MIDLSEIETSPIDDRVKGMPGGIPPLPLGAVGQQGWNLLREDLPLPVAVLREGALAHNGDWMRRFLGASGAFIAPHGKTTMSPQLFKRQLDDGAWAITIGSVQQLQAIRHAGVSRVVLANQLVGARAIRYVLDELRRDPAFDFYALADSVASVETLAAAARAAEIGRPLQLFVEGGFIGGRTGARDLPTALAVARAIKAAEPDLALRGVEGYEGLLHGRDDAESDRLVRDFLDYIAEIAVACAKEKLFAPGQVIVTAGGSTFYDLVVQRFRAADLPHGCMALTRSGCYLTHDSGPYRERFQALRRRTPSVDALGAGLEPALEVWAYVQSRPEPTKAILTMGRRDVGFDARLPEPLKWFRPAPGASAKNLHPIGAGHEVTDLNDQHCHLRLPAESPLQVGDMVGFGISHPCTTFDKWQVMCVINDNYDVVSAIRTFF